MNEGAELYRQYRFRQAATRYTEAHLAAMSERNRDCALAALGNRMGVLIAAQQHAEARRTFAQADQLARAGRDWQMVGVLSTNLSTLHARMGDRSRATEAAARAARAFAAHGPSPHRARLLLQRAKLAAWQEAVPLGVGLPAPPDARTARHWRTQMAAATPLFREAIAEAERWQDWAAAKQAWEQWAVEHLHRGEVASAEQCLTHAAQAARQRDTPQGAGSVRTRALLRAAQGRWEEAERLFGEALALAANGRTTVPAWALRHQRGLARRVLRRTADALADLQEAARLARLYRVAALPEERSRRTLDVHLQDVYDALLDAALTRHQETGEPQLLAVALAAVEENRAVSLRERWLAGRPQLPTEYWETLAEYRAALERSAQTDADAGLLPLLEARLDDEELKAGLLPGATAPLPTGEAILAHVRQRRERGEALFSFALGETRSYRLTLADEGLRVRVLPSRATLARWAAELRAALAADRPTWRVPARLLGEALFGDLSAEVAASTAWVLAVDTALHDVPLAALPVPHPGGWRYAVEDHSLLLVPGWAAFEPRQDTHQGRWVGIGDPVTNAADARWRGPPLRRAGVMWPRLPGSGREVASCARLWPHGASVLLGAQATRRNLKALLAQPTAVLHIATHFLPVAADREAAVLLSLQTAGQHDLITSRDLAGWRVPGSLVVLNGCQSGAGPAIRGSGLWNLGRSWLAAGAQNVISTYWPVDDEQGEFFQKFYRWYGGASGRGSRAVAEALREAQRAVIRSRPPQASPRSWAAYFVTGKG